MAHIVLIQAPYRDLYGPIKKAAGYYFPLGLGYIAAVLRRQGHRVGLYEPEAQKMSFQDISRVFATERPDVIGIGSATPNFFNAIELAKSAKSVGATVVLGGIHASVMPHYIAENYSDYFDYVVVGEGEDTMLDLVAHLENGRDPAAVPGVFLKQNNEVVSTPSRARITDLDALPFPARDLLPMELFPPNLHNSRYKKSFTILTSRGCPYKCSFCASHNTMGSKYRYHSPEYVLEEMEYLVKQYGAQQLLITDDTFTLNTNRLVNICEGMIRRKLNLKWFCFSQASRLNAELLELMQRAGCYNIGFGIESAIPRIQKLIGKPVSLSHCLELVKITEKLGIKSQAFFVFGHEENLAEIRATIDYANHLNATLVFHNMLVPYPGTKDFERFFSDIPLEEIDWKNFVAIGEKSVLGRSRFNFEKIIYEAYREFYARPTQLWRMAKQIKTWFELKNYFLGGMGLLSQMLVWKNQS
ncbi:MAG: B12-binding domain-containing radical SAM protein [Deltaproteobacteria bacterium]|nr:B12-binding domain-containing radical SAM protein [Deltaproteobacteria bacterium]